MMHRHRPPERSPRGQTLVELSLVLPLFLMVLFGIVILGIGVFYQQQLTNAAREAARYASIHSATAQCPTVPSIDPIGANKPLTYTRCDRPEDAWPFMVGHARDAIEGMPAGNVLVSACWSGYRAGGGTGAYDSWVPGTYDAFSPPLVITEAESVFVQCTIDGHDPTLTPELIECREGMPRVDQASAASEAAGRAVGNAVTAYACYVWRPPLAGFLLIPPQVTMRAVITEPIQRQQ